MRKHGEEKGFTLIELMVVIVILAALATLVAPRFFGQKEEALRTKAKVQIRNFEQALQLFHLDNGFYPSTEQGLIALAEAPSVGRIPRKWREGGYMDKVPKDPWGADYVYISPGVNSKDYDIISYGPDGQEGGEGADADIQNWTLDED